MAMKMFEDKQRKEGKSSITPSSLGTIN